MSTCKYCGNGDNHNSLCPGKVISELSAELAAKDAEIERLRLALETENQAATMYAKQVAHWVEKHDKLLAAREERERQEPVAWSVRNGVCDFQIWYDKLEAEKVVAIQQKKHDLSGSLAAFHVVPLFDRPAPVPAVPEGMALVPMSKLTYEDCYRFGIDIEAVRAAAPHHYKPANGRSMLAATQNGKENEG